MSASQTEPFVPNISIDGDGFRYVEVRPMYSLGVDLLLDREMCYLHDDTCAAIVRWVEESDGTLVPKIYAPSAEKAALVPSDVTLIEIALLREQGTLVDFRNVLIADQTYWIGDLRAGKEDGRDYYFSTDQPENPNVPHLSPETPYVFQEEVASPVLAYDELVALVQEPPSPSLVIDEPLSSGVSTHQLYDDGFRVIIEDMTAVQRAFDAREETP